MSCANGAGGSGGPVGAGGVVDWRPIWDGPFVQEGAAPFTRVVHAGEECLEIVLPAGAAKPDPGDGGHYATWSMVDQNGALPDWTTHGEPCVLMMRIREIGSSSLTAGHEYGMVWSNRDTPLDSLAFYGSLALKNTGGDRDTISIKGVAGARNTTYTSVGASTVAGYGYMVPNIVRDQGGGADVFSVTINRGVIYGVDAGETANTSSAVPVPQGVLGGNGVPRWHAYAGHVGALAADTTVRFLPEYALIRLSRIGEQF